MYKKTDIDQIKLSNGIIGKQTDVKQCISVSLWLVKSSRVALFLSREQWQLWGQQWVRAPLQLSRVPGVEWLSDLPLTGQIRTSTTPALSGKAQAGQPWYRVIVQ